MNRTTPFSSLTLITVFALAAFALVPSPACAVIRNDPRVSTEAEDSKAVSIDGGLKFGFRYGDKPIICFCTELVHQYTTDIFDLNLGAQFRVHDFAFDFSKHWKVNNGQTAVAAPLKHREVKTPRKPFSEKLPLRPGGQVGLLKQRPAQTVEPPKATLRSSPIEPWPKENIEGVYHYHQSDVTRRVEEPDENKALPTKATSISAELKSIALVTTLYELKQAPDKNAALIETLELILNKLQKGNLVEREHIKLFSSLTVFHEAYIATVNEPCETNESAAVRSLQLMKATAALTDGLRTLEKGAMVKEVAWATLNYAMAKSRNLYTKYTEQSRELQQRLARTGARNSLASTYLAKLKVRDKALETYVKASQQLLENEENSQGTPLAELDAIRDSEIDKARDKSAALTNQRNALEIFEKLARSFRELERINNALDQAA